MNHTDLLKSVEAEANANIPDIFPGDSVSVHYKIKEGDRERIQEFKLTCWESYKAYWNEKWAEVRSGSGV